MQGSARKSFALAALVVLAGCAGPAVKKVDIATSSGGQSVSAGFSNSVFQQTGMAGTLFIRLQYSGDHPTVTEINSARLRPQDSNEEVLAFLSWANLFTPAYESLALFNAPTSTFQCAPLLNPHKSTYHPCGSGSRLTSASAGTTAARDAFSVVSLGLAAGIDLGVDANKILGIVRDEHLLDLISRFQALQSAASDASDQARQSDRNLLDAMVPQIKVTNLSGFPTPDVGASAINLRVTRDTNFSVPTSVRLDGGGDGLAAALASISAHKEQLLANPVFSVSCGSSANLAPFDNDVVCDKQVVASSGSLKPNVGVTLKSISVGVQYPMFEARNKTLAARIRDGGLVLSNLSEQYVEIESISLYGGSEVSTRKQERSLAPTSELKTPISLSEISNNDLDRVFRLDNVTASDVRKRSAVFGIAVKYRVGDGGNFETLHSLGKVSLADLVHLQ